MAKSRLVQKLAAFGRSEHFLILQLEIYVLNGLNLLNCNLGKVAGGKIFLLDGDSRPTDSGILIN